MKKKEIIFVFILLVSALGWLMVQSFAGKSGETARVDYDNRLYGTYPLSRERIIKIGESNTLEITEGKIRMKEATCPDQICRKQGWIKRKGESIICLPNKVIVTLEGTEEEFDGVIN
ncbi:MAG: NusG domain II-containing protein [Lachnospiraceae bacterium]|nr:NusG domain II-containing protein [Lachnospiraceae bacterium]